MAACCAIGALVIYKLMSIYSHLPQLRSATLEKDEAQPKNDEGLNVDQKSDAGPQTCRFSLHGLTCMSCVSAVEKSLRAAPGVQEVSVSLHALTAFVTFDATQISPRELQSAVENTGFAAQLSGNEDDWKSQWTTAATSRQRSIQEWQDAFNKSVLAGLLVFSLDTLSPWIDRPSLVTAFGVIANAVTAVSILWLAGAIHREALAALRHGRLDTSTLSSAGLLCVLASASLQELLGQSEGRGTVPLTSACMLLTLTIGVKLIKCAVSKRSSQLPTLLASALPDTASLLLATNGGRIKQAVPLHLIQPGDLVHIETGASFPGDCVIVEGEASVLQTIVNGELDPVNVKVGESVHAGSTNCGCAVIGNVLRVGKDTWLGNTLNAISRANREKSSLESFSDRFLDWFGTVVLALAVASAILQLKDKASLLAVLNKTASILLCACPCTMGMGIPVCLMAAIRNAHDAGIMLTAGPQIEKAASSRIAVFDKTGTLTSGNLKMKEVQLEPEWKANEVRLWDMIRAVVQRSQHPVSRLLVQHSHCVIQETKEHCVAMVLSHEEVPGLGQQGHLTVLDQDYDIGIGNHRFMQARGVYLESVVSHSTGVLYVCVDGKLAMYATYEDEIIPEAANLVVELHVRGFRTYMMTGDTMENARDVALRAGIPVENVHASLLPHDKASLVESLERRYGPVIMVGDDLNDAPALAAATFGIITSRDRAAQSPKQDPRAVEILQKLHQEADALLTPDKSTASQPCGLIRVAYIVDLIRETFRRMRRILQWSLMYNTIALVMVSGGMNSVMPGTRWEGKVLDPTLASLFMSINSVVTLTYCLRMESWRPDAQHGKLK